VTRLTFSPVGGYWAVAVALLILIALMYFGPVSRRITRSRKHILAAIRMAIILLVALALLRPTLVYSTIQKRSATLVVLVDRSRSMLVTDGVGRATRWQELRDALDRALPELAALDEDLELKIYTFDSDAQQVDFTGGTLDLENDPDGQQSAIGAVLKDVLQREAGKRLAGVVLLSDGAQRAIAPRDELPHVEARRLADVGSPLYTLAFGQPRGLGQSRDIAVRDLLASRTVFEKNELEVTSTVQIDGFVDQNVVVELLYETSPGQMEVVDSTTISTSQSGSQLPVKFTYVPQSQGGFAEHKLTLRAVQKPGELVTTNNQLSTIVTVLQGGLNVLYIEGAFRAEQKWLRWALDASPDIQVDHLRLDAQKPDTRPADLAARFEPGKYDVTMFGDVDSSAFRESELEQLARTIQGGAGFIMNGGFHSFGPGGYGRTPLAAVLPIVIDRTERQRFSEPIVPDLHLPGKRQMRPTVPLGRDHPVMQLAPGPANLDAWQRLPELEGANRFRGVKPLAAVLAETLQGEPLLVQGQFGEGRVLAFAGDSTWLWWTQGHEAAHKRFWRQAILWLAKVDAPSDGTVWVRLEPRRFAPGSRVQFTAGFEPAAGEAPADVQFTARLKRPDGTIEPIRMARQGDEFAGSILDTRQSGDYVIEVQAAAAAQPLGEGRARFLVYEQDLELDNPAADPALLATLAGMTGGEKLLPEQLPGLLRQIQEDAGELDVETQRKETLWDRWPFFILFVSLLGTEWFLRKRWGLV